MSKTKLIGKDGSAPLSVMLETLTTTESHECVQQIISLFQNSPKAKVYCTHTGKGDLRVRAYKENGALARVAFVMNWRNTKGNFSCRSSLFPEEISYPGDGSICSKPEPASKSHPQKSQFCYEPRASNDALLNIILASVERCRIAA